MKTKHNIKMTPVNEVGCRTLVFNNELVKIIAIHEGVKTVRFQTKDEDGNKGQFTISRDSKLPVLDN